MSARKSDKLDAQREVLARFVKRAIPCNADPICDPPVLKSAFTFPDSVNRQAAKP